MGNLKGEDMTETRTATQLAKVLIKQIEQRSPQCSFWLFSAVDKLVKENPDMTLVSLRDVLVEEIPHSARKYCEYIGTA